MPDDPEVKADGENDGNYEKCEVQHGTCKVGNGDCTMRKSHKNWGQDHVCNKCSETW